MQVCNLRMVQLLFLFCLLLFFISKQFYPTPIFFALYYVSSIFQGLRFHFQRMGVCIADFFNHEPQSRRQCGESSLCFCFELNSKKLKIDAMSSLAALFPCCDRK